MRKFTNEQILKLYKIMGLKEPKFFNEKEIINLYKLLKIEPKKNLDGSRVLTPYEILGVLPVFENGEEKPIVFSIKHRAEKIGKYEGKITKFVYEKSKIKEEKTAIQTLKEKYKSAVFAGNYEEAETCLEMIDELTGGRADEFIDSFYDYSKFYKRMKKQLLIDLFAHFFLLYLQKKSSIIKSGIILKNKVYKPYREKTVEYNQDVTFNSEMDIVSYSPNVDPVNFGFENLKKVVINDQEMGDVVEFEIGKKDIKVKTSQSFEESKMLQQSGNLNSSQTSAFMVEGMIQPMQNNVEIPQTEHIEESKKSHFGGFFNSFIRRRKKLFHKPGLGFEQTQEKEEENSSYSKIRDLKKEIEKER